MARSQLPIARVATAAALAVWLVQRTGHRVRVAPHATTLSSVPPVWVADVRADSEGWLGVGLRMPDKPFEGQRTPPCAPAQVTLNGGCWYQVTPAPGSVKPGEACSSEMFQRDGKCFIPVRRAERVPTTIQEAKP